MFAPITKVNEGESNTPCPSTRVEKLYEARSFSRTSYVCVPDILQSVSRISL
jgi:hypothetical protein